MRDSCIVALLKMEENKIRGDIRDRTSLLFCSREPEQGSRNQYLVNVYICHIQTEVCNTVSYQALWI